MKPINLYRSDGDREVWERADRDAQASGLSLAGHVVAVLRDQQKRDERRAARARNAEGEVSA